MGKSTYIGLAVGILVGVFTAGVGFAAYAFTAGVFAFGITSSLLQARTANKSLGGSGIKDAVAGDFEFTSASESVTIPVIFGIIRNPGNFLRYDKSTFQAAPIYATYEQPKGGKGGEPETETVATIQGYNYYMSFDLGLCMGEVDEVRQIYDGTKLTAMSSPASFTGDSVVMVATNAESSGTVRVYRGSAAQTRVPGEVYSDAQSNYRGVCFASFQTFWIGTSPTPRSYLFELHRRPRVLDDDGNAIADFPVRGSNNPADAEWYDANPAAIIWEILTNKEWGSGSPAALLDVESFRKCAKYYESKKIGLSLSLESQDDLGSYIDTIRQHVGLILVRSGSVTKAICLLDTVNNEIKDVLSAESVMMEPQFSRPAYPSQTNEIKVRFINRSNGFKQETVLQQDAAAIANAQRVNSKELQMNGFPSRRLAEEQAFRMLYEMSYPQATLTILVNRTLRAAPGELFEFRWGEFSEGTAVTYWRIRRITEKKEGFEVEASEDIYSTPYEGTPVPHQPLVPAFEGATLRTDADINFGEDTATPEDLDPVFVIEENIWLSRYRPAAIAVTRDGGNGHINTAWYWTSDTVDKSFINTNTGKAATGFLRSDITAERIGVVRGQRTFQIEFDSEFEAVEAMASASKVNVSTDHFETVLQGTGDMLVIGNEIFVVGKITESATPGYHDVVAYMRAMHGTDAAEHSSGDRLFFIGTWNRGFEIVMTESMPINEALAISATAITTRGEEAVSFEWEGQLQRRGICPFAPSLRNVSKVGSVWTCSLRPRWHKDGAYSQNDFEQDLNGLVTRVPEKYAWLIQPYSAGIPTGDIETIVPTFIPDDGRDPETGLLSFSYDVGVATEIRIWTILDGKKSLEPLAVS